MAGDVSDNGSDNTDSSNGNDECGVSIGNALNSTQNELKRI